VLKRLATGGVYAGDRAIGGDPLLTPLLALLLGSIPASAGAIVLSPTIGHDFATDQFWAGLDFALHADGMRNVVPVGRITPGWAIADSRPMLFAEGGVAFALPREGAIVRLGAVVNGTLLDAPYRLPWELRDKEEAHLGIIPGMALLLEFEFGEERPFVFGARGGVRSSSSNYLCRVPDDVEHCLAWYPGFTGGFLGRGAVTDWLYLELLIGPSPYLAVGYPF
jgi:hypothetical protein